MKFLKSNILFLFLNTSIVWSLLWFYRWRTDGSIGSSWANNEFFFAEISPIRHSFVSASFPFIFREDSVLFNHPLCFQFLHISLIFWLLYFYQVIFLIIKFLENFMTNFLIEILEGGLIKWQFPFFDSLFILFFPLIKCSFSGFPHDPQINFPFLLI